MSAQEAYLIRCVVLLRRGEAQESVVRPGVLIRSTTDGDVVTVFGDERSDGFVTQQYLLSFDPSGKPGTWADYR